MWKAAAAGRAADARAQGDARAELAQASLVLVVPYVVRVDVRKTKRAGGLRRCRRFAEFVQALHDARLGVVAVVEQIEPGTQPEFLLAASRVRVRADVDIRAAERADAPNLARELERARERSERPSERALRSERGFHMVDDVVVVFGFSALAASSSSRDAKTRGRRRVRGNIAS